MVKRKKGLWITALLSSAVLALGTGVGIMAVADEGNAAAPETLQERAALGETVTIPEYFVELNGETVKATVQIVAPSGAIYAGSKFVANEAGEYIIQYLINGEIVDTDSCMVAIGSADLFSVNALASIDGIRDYNATDYTLVDEATGQTCWTTNAADRGVAIDVQNGATVTFEHEIDMRNRTKYDVLFAGMIEAKVQGEADLSQMILTFTDVEDENTYFKVTITDGIADGVMSHKRDALVYINAGANGQMSGGMNHGKKQFETTSIYGTDAIGTFRGKEYIGNRDHSIRLYYDSAENALYTLRYEQVELIADFDDPTIFQTTVWDGFKSGKAKLSVSFAEVKERGATVIFREIDGIRLDSEEIVDNGAPILSVDLQGESKAPNAVLGTEYSVFPYVVDDFYDANVKVSVTVSHESTSGVTTDVSVVDGKFMTSKLGKYTIRYVAKDYSGNTASQEYSFDCIATAEAIKLTGVWEDFSGEVFKEVEIPTSLDVRAYGGCGDLRLEMHAFDPNGVEIDVADGSFYPDQIGTYTVIYRATDYFGSYAEEELKIEIAGNNETLFLNGIVLPEILIAGFDYTIPEIFAKACADGAVVDCKIAYLVNGEELSSRAFTASGEQAVIECRAYTTDSSSYQSIQKTITVIDGQLGKEQAPYFYDKSGAISVVETMDTVDLTTEADSTVTFANKLKGDGFTLGVSYDAKTAKFLSFNVILCDALDTAKTITLKFAITADGVSVTTPYGQATAFTSAGGKFEMNFYPDSGLITDSDGVVIAAALKDDAGNALNGFEEGLYARFGFNGVYGESKISLSKLNNQPLGYRTTYEDEKGDSKGPEVQLWNELATKVNADEEVTIFGCDAYDVLNQVESTTVKVQAPSGETVIEETDANKNLTLRVTECGYYKVTYTAYDKAGQRTRVVRNIRVVDAHKPTLEVDFEDMQKSVGKKVSLPDVEVSDDTGIVYYDIFLSLPTSEMRLLYHYENIEGEVTKTSYLSKDDDNYPNSFKASNTSFILEMEGKYVLTVMAYDASYNITTQSFTIIAK